MLDLSNVSGVALNQSRPYFILWELIHKQNMGPIRQYMLQEISANGEYV